MEPLTAGAIAYAIARVTGPIIKPAQEEVGAALGRWAEFKLRNVGRAVKNAESKVVDLSAEEMVPPRLITRWVEEASYSDEDVVVEYLGGVLASSRSADGSDDRGVAYSSLVAQMSSPQLRLHYVVYRILREALVGRTAKILKEYFQTEIYIPYHVLGPAINEENWGERFDSVFTHALYGLSRLDLVGTYLFGPTGADLESVWQGASHGGLVLSPSRGGCDLFLWGLGRGQVGIWGFFDSSVQTPTFDLEIKIPAGAAVRFGDQMIELGPMS